MSRDQTLNINEASKACGLSPSVLRIWELRYGWPKPKRKANGYRAYTPHQVQELKRMANLVNTGMSISSLIIDGLPQWPAEEAPVPKKPKLTSAKSLPEPDDREGRRIQRNIIDALETKRGSLVPELVQRCTWTVRPNHELLAALLPAFIGLHEVNNADVELPEEDQIRTLIRRRCDQLIRRFPIDDSALWVVPMKERDELMAFLTALTLNDRGIQARAASSSSSIPDNAQVVAVTEGRFSDVSQFGNRLLARVAPNNRKTCLGLAQIYENVSQVLDQPTQVS